MKMNKRLIPALAVMGAFALLLASAPALQSNDSEAVGPYTLTINLAGGSGYAKYSLDSGLNYTNYTAPIDGLDVGNEVKIKAFANAGWQFDKWETPAVQTTEEIEIFVASSQTINLYFKVVKVDLLFMGAGVKWNLITVSGGDPVIDGNKATYNFGAKIKVSTETEEGYEGTPVIKIGSDTYIAGTEYTVNNPVTFTVSGMSLKTYTVTFVKTDGVVWKVGTDSLESGTKVYSHGTKIKVNVEKLEGFAGTPEIKAGGNPYTANTDYEVKSNVSFTVTGVSGGSDKTESGGGSSIILFAAIGVVALLVVGAALWMFWFKKP